MLLHTGWNKSCKLLETYLRNDYWITANIGLWTILKLQQQKNQSEYFVKYIFEHILLKLAVYGIIIGIIYSWYLHLEINNQHLIKTCIGINKMLKLNFFWHTKKNKWKFRILWGSWSFCRGDFWRRWALRPWCRRRVWAKRWPGSS